jgi:hypothetical protein
LATARVLEPVHVDVPIDIVHVSTRAATNESSGNDRFVVELPPLYLLAVYETSWSLTL